MESDSFSFDNCSGLTYQQFTDIALARRITAALCCAISLIVLLVLVVLAVLTKVFRIKALEKLKICEAVVKRLVIWLTAATVPYQLILAIHSQPKSTFPHGVCKAFGFLIQYFGSVQLLLTLGISTVLFFKVWDATPWKPERVDSCHKRTKACSFACCGCKINKLEVVFLVLVFGLPLLFDWIPFVTNSYGAIGPWCWIRSIEKNCTIHTAGQIEQIVLWDLPFGLVVLLTFVLFLTSLCLLACTIRKSKAQNLIEKVITNSVFSLSFLAVIFVFGVLELSTHVSLPSYRQNFRVWVVYAIFTPLGGVLIPVALLTAIFLPLSSVTDKCTHGGRKKQGQATLERTTVNHDSHLYRQQSETAFEPSHEDSEDVSLLCVQQKQGYSSTA